MYLIIPQPSHISFNEIDSDIMVSDKFNNDMFVVDLTEGRKITTFNFVDANVSNRDRELYRQSIKISRRTHLRYKKYYVRDNT